VKTVHRGVALVALVVGIGLVITTLALSLFSRAYAGEQIADGFGQVMSPQGVVQQKQGLGMVAGMLGGLTDARPTFARELGLSPAAYDRYVAANFPAVTTALTVIPPAAATIVAPVVTAAGKIQPKWEQVVHIPGLGLAIAGAPWLIVLGGVALAIAGLFGLVRPGRGVTIALLGFGVALIVVPLALSLPEKASDTRDVLKVGRIAVSQKAATAAHKAALIVDDMVGEINGQMIPDLARRLHVSPAALDQRIDRDYPGLGTGLREYPGIAAAAYQLTAVQQAAVGPFKKVDGIGYSGLPWLAIGPGILLMVLAGGALLADRSKPRGTP
jgi:hypothetical protein